MDNQSSTTQRLLAAAQQLTEQIRRKTAAMGGDDACREIFEQAYREWIIANYGLSSKANERMERVRLLMLAMLAAPSLERAIDHMLRFAKLSMEGIGAESARVEGDYVALRLSWPYQAGVSGLLAELWPLSLHLSMLEFLVGRTLSGVYGQLRNTSLLSADITATFFDRPLHYEATDLALFIPTAHLKLAVIAAPEQVFEFRPRLLPLLLAPLPQKYEYTSLIEAFLRTHILRGSDIDISFSSIASRLGCSPATLRRHLVQEGTTFRDIRAQVTDEIAKHWLLDRKLNCAEIGERLGYLDTTSFQRAFSKMNGCTPTTYRRQVVKSAFSE